MTQPPGDWGRQPPPPGGWGQYPPGYRHLDEEYAGDDAGSAGSGPIEVSAELPTARAASVVALLGVGSLPGLLFCLLGAPMAVIALALAPWARRQVLATGGREGGLGLIRTARICSVVSLLVSAVVVGSFVLVLALVID